MQNQAPKSDKIGIFLPVPAERDEIVECLAGDSLTTVKLADLGVLQSPTLPEYDALILPISAWPAARHLLQVARETPAEIGPGPTLIFCSPGDADFSAIDPREIGENVSFIRYPLELRLFPFQLQAILRRRQIVHDLRYRLKEREDVLRSISEVFFSVDHNFRYTFFNEKAQQVGGKSEEELLGQDMWASFPSLKNTEFHRQIWSRSRGIAKSSSPNTSARSPAAGSRCAYIPPPAAYPRCLSISPPVKKPRKASSRRRSDSARPMPTWSARLKVAERTRPVARRQPAARRAPLLHRP